jgi:HD-GYP domain-containing protein (c-di-GMP phosphodiesterase class II)
VFQGGIAPIFYRVGAELEIIGPTSLRLDTFPIHASAEVNSSILIDVSQLRVGMFIQLDLGWMHHPFPVSSFRVASIDQIATLKELGLKEVRYVPKKSAPESTDSSSVLESVLSEPALAETDGQNLGRSVSEVSVPTWSEDHAPTVQAPGASLAECNQRFGEATRYYKSLESEALEHPEQARATTGLLVSSCVKELLTNGDSVIRLLSEGVGERSALHPVNVMVVSLLLGQSLGLSADELHDLGVAALVHDLGKLPTAKKPEARTSQIFGQDNKHDEAHVGKSVSLAVAMGFSSAVLKAIAQHHEMADGSGFPLRLTGGDIGRNGQVLALVNQFDRMCNPSAGAEALTPHEALSVLFAQQRNRFDSDVLRAFIRMMGVYPPGSIVQLANDQYGIVTSVNFAQPLRPKVMVHDPSIDKDQAPILNLELMAGLGIRRSLKPAQLPRDALDYLMPRQRICYFFERAVFLGPAEADA